MANSCRAGIAQVTHFAARFVSEPTRQHVLAVKRILSYLKATINVGISFKTNVTYKLQGYADADFANDLTDATSTTGFIFIANGPISWKSRRQQLTALSTTEAEVNALAEDVKDASWLSTMLKQMKLVPDNYTIKMYEDNAGCLLLVNGRRTPARTKHIAVRIGYIRDLINSSVISVTRCSTDDMVADPLTKPLGSVEFQRKTGELLTSTTDSAEDAPESGGTGVHTNSDDDQQCFSNDDNEESGAERGRT